MLNTMQYVFIEELRRNRGAGGGNLREKATELRVLRTNSEIALLI